jgi:dipeptidyl aminopeptidase
MRTKALLCLLQQWRHSSHSNFYIHNISRATTSPLVEPTYPPATSIATWAPAGHSIAYVHANNLYVLPASQSSPIQVSTSGNETRFIGIPDWVYEEEVFASDSAIWWSPDGRKLAYLTFDETSVPLYEFPRYNPSPWTPGAVPYPEEVETRYPKPGYPNPIVTLHVFDLDRYELAPPSRPATQSGLVGDPVEVDSRVRSATYDLVFDKNFEDEDRIVVEVVWLGDSNLLVKETNRISNKLRVAQFGLENSPTSSDMLLTGRVVREVDYEAVDGGWYEPVRCPHPCSHLRFLAKVAYTVPKYPPLAVYG